MRLANFQLLFMNLSRKGSFLFLLLHQPCLFLLNSSFKLPFTYAQSDNIVVVVFLVVVVVFLVLVGGGLFGGVFVKSAMI